MSRISTVATLTIGLGLAVAAGAQPAPPSYGQMPAGGQMMGQGQMMGGQNAMMNDPQMRQRMTEMRQGCERMMGRMNTERMRQRSR